MTAEIAILNKTAVALAADSAVTISAGSTQEKVFDSAEKLFQLSNINPLGIMIYNGMSFMEAPISVLVRQFRDQAGSFETVNQAMERFLDFLNDFGKDSPQKVKDRAARSVIMPVFQRITKRRQDKFVDAITASPSPADPMKLYAELLDEAAEVFLRVLTADGSANFVGKGPLKPTGKHEALIESLITEVGVTSDQQRKLFKKVAHAALRSGRLSSGRTGVVIAGFGSGERFPSLASVELDGVVCGRLKYKFTHHVDIDRGGDRAKVLPFAQKEMVDRFLYGLDDTISRKVTAFCQEAISDVSNAIIDRLDFPKEEDRQAMVQDARDAEKGFIDALRDKAFDALREESRMAIEDMVEFMPKPELAKMAEALVNLTSIKRKVSRGVETVGGPIDVAVISLADGLVWVKRKHYFPTELNMRYGARVQSAAVSREEDSHGSGE